MRNLLFDRGVIPSYRSSLKVLVIGNLSTGGTGKTPFTEYLLRQLTGRKLAVVSRGYGRRSKGLQWVESSSAPSEVGDEALQVKQHFPGVPVLVSEERATALKELESVLPETEMVVLDDAFQHRYVQADCSILLTAFHCPYYTDWPLPAGDLREGRKESRRADIIVVTKCPAQLSDEQKKHILSKLRPQGRQKVFFSTLEYGELMGMMLNEPISYETFSNWLLVTGIARDNEMRNHLNNKVTDLDVLSFPDHAVYDKNRVVQILKAGDQRFGRGRYAIITTEKDAVKLRLLAADFGDVRVAVLPVQMKVMHEQNFFEALSERINH